MREARRYTTGCLQDHPTPTQSQAIVPIPGSRRTDRQKENAAAAGIVLSGDMLAEIDGALDSMEMSPVFGGSKIIKE